MWSHSTQHFAYVYPVLEEEVDLLLFYLSLAFFNENGGELTI
jgi:hypothetical protein